MQRTLLLSAALTGLFLAGCFRPPPLPRRKLDAKRLAELLASLRDNEIVAERAGEFGGRLRRALHERGDPAGALA